MSIFGSIASAVFGTAKTPSAAVANAAPGTAAAAPAAAPSARASPMTREQVEAMIQKLEDESGQDFNWRESIVDLMKLLKLDSSLKARQELAKELGYTGALTGSAEMNVWLHKQVMTRLMEGKDIVRAA